MKESKNIRIDDYSPSHVTSCCTQKRNYHKGYKWKYYDDRNK